MSTKKIWISALIFGLITTALLYIFLVSRSADDKPSPIEEAPEPELSEEDLAKLQEEENEEANTMLPITDGHRAMSLQVNIVQGVSGFIKPGSFVDVISIMEPSEEEFSYTAGQHAAATLLLQNKKVLAVGHSADTTEEAKRYETVTLELTPKEALFLGFASRDQLYLSLRKDGDNSVEPDATHIHEDDLHEGVFKP